MEPPPTDPPETDPGSADPSSQPRRFATLATQTLVITCVVALVSVLTTTAIAWPLANQMATEEARRTLASQADFVADMVRSRAKPVGKKRLIKRLRRSGIDVVLIAGGSASPKNIVPDHIVERVARDQRPVSTTVEGADGQELLIEGRTVGTDTRAWLGWGVVLYEPLNPSISYEALSRLALALPLGMLAGIAAGYLLARRVTRPLRRAAMAAQRLSGGERDVALPIESPAEVADLSQAINELNRALATSEDQQRAFLMSVSHELRTPMTTIQGYAEAIADGVLPPDQARESGQIMLSEAARLDRLVADLLALARLRAQEFRVEMVVVDLVAVVDGAAAAWRPKCREYGVELRTELSPGAVWAYTDPGRIRQVLDILVENALRLVPAGAPIILSAYAENHLAVAEVRDGGPGLTDQDIAVAFEQGALNRRYAGVRRVGTGLGLALAHQLITRLGGRIAAGHAPEGGARFTFQLPLRFQ